MSLDECLNAFDPEIFQQDFAIWILLGLGGLVVLAALYGVIFSKHTIATTAVLLLIGGAFIGVSVTGKIPAISGSLSAVTAGSEEIRKTWRAACVERELAKPTDVPESVPTEAVELPTPTQEPTDALAMLVNDSTLVWIFYAPSRSNDADHISKILEKAGAAVVSAADDFSQVKNKQPPGTTRVIFATDKVKAAATALAEIMRENQSGTNFVVQGPYASISKGPIQIQLY